MHGCSHAFVEDIRLIYNRNALLITSPVYGRLFNELTDTIKHSVYGHSK